ncbi:sugar ABC transporter permease [Paenibacillus hemerocallicola]|uniref:Sugar ABC transporter permease n=2 Tax=Paenibacillus hemerocallicola TaxID=1172614 RepID=A0A5C4SYX2_9BACL|nr:sugar ABC transporter permease [Paenibacillus hemerocallicola]
MIRSKAYYVMFFIPLVYFLVFHYVPMFGILIAFKNYNVFQGVFDSPWVGTKYFRQFLTDPYFYKLVRNTLLIGLYHIMFSFPAPIVLALLLNELKHHVFKRFVQTVSYLPHFLSTVVVVGIIVNFMSYDGIMNQFMGLLGLEPVHFLMSPEWFRSIYIGSEIWQGIGWGSIIYLAALTAIDPQLYEAATIDGANRWKQMIHVTLPGIAPTIVILLLFNIGAVMNVSFEKILLLSNGSNQDASDVIALHVYRRGLISSDFSYATAVGLFNSVIAVLLLTFANRVSKKVSETSLW